MPNSPLTEVQQADARDAARDIRWLTTTALVLVGTGVLVGVLSDRGIAVGQPAPQSVDPSKSSGSAAAPKSVRECCDAFELAELDLESGMPRFCRRAGRAAR